VVGLTSTRLRWSIQVSEAIATGRIEKKPANEVRLSSESAQENARSLARGGAGNREARSRTDGSGKMGIDGSSNVKAVVQQ
jgi:hypothetical protein